MPPSPEIDPALEREYALRSRHPERGAVYERFAAASAAFRQGTDAFRSLRYGASPNNAIDFVRAETTAAAPLFVFIHGGYWRALDRSIFTFLARPWLARGVHVALPGYDLAPALRVRDIAAQVEAATACLLARAGPLGIDPDRIVVGGHSAGAQLGALLLDRLPRGAAGFIGVSGIYDLQPLRATSINADVRLDAGEARELSPRWRVPDPRPRYLCAVGAAETDGFRSQSHDYAAALRRQGCRAESIEVPGRTHFDVLDELADPESELFRKSLDLLRPPNEGTLSP